VPRRILAVLAAVLAILAVTPARLGSEPATTTTAAPAIGNTPEDTPTNPLRGVWRVAA